MAAHRWDMARLHEYSSEIKKLAFCPIWSALEQGARLTLVYTSTYKAGAQVKSGQTRRSSNVFNPRAEYRNEKTSRGKWFDEII